jgi:hypothetical protein
LISNGLLAAGVALSDGGGTLFDDSWTPFSGEFLGVFQEVGSLGPGTYTRVAEAMSTSSDGGADGDFNVIATFVPEPSTAALLALGLVALAARRRSG